MYSHMQPMPLADYINQVINSPGFIPARSQLKKVTFTNIHGCREHWELSETSLKIAQAEIIRIGGTNIIIEDYPSNEDRY